MSSDESPTREFVHYLEGTTLFRVGALAAIVLTIVGGGFAILRSTGSSGNDNTATVNQTIVIGGDLASPDTSKDINEDSDVEKAQDEIISTTSTTLPSEPAPPVRWTGPEVELKTGLNLDETPVRNTSFGGNDIGNRDGTIYAANNGSDGAEVGLLAPDLEPTWEGCVASLAALAPDRKTSIGNPEVGDVYCFRSRDGRIAVAEYSREGVGVIYLNVTTWELPDN